MCAKTIFNYLCWSNSVEFMLDSKFDVLKKYIRYDEWNDRLWFRCNSSHTLNATSPVVGTMLNFNDGVCELLGLGK